MTFFSFEVNVTKRSGLPVILLFRTQSICALKVNVCYFLIIDVGSNRVFGYIGVYCEYLNFVIYN